MERLSTNWNCPVCKKSFKPQGKGGHLFSKHGFRNEAELAEILKGKEIKLLPENPKQVSKTETVTRVIEHVFETPVEHLETPMGKEKDTCFQHLSETPVESPDKTSVNCENNWIIVDENNNPLDFSRGGEVPKGAKIIFKDTGEEGAVLYPYGRIIRKSLAEKIKKNIFLQEFAKKCWGSHDK